MAFARSVHCYMGMLHVPILIRKVQHLDAGKCRGQSAVPSLSTFKTQIKFGYSGTTHNGLLPSTNPEAGRQHLPRLGVARMPHSPLPQSFGEQASIKVLPAKTT